MEELKNLFILSFFFLLVFAVGEIAYRHFKVKAEYTRKWSHIASGFLSLLFPHYFDSVVWVFIICAGFTVILLWSKKAGLLPSINAVDRKTYGSILFPLAVFISFCAYKIMDGDPGYFYQPVLTLAICDLLAAVVGKKYPFRRVRVFNERKSLGGLTAFILSSMVLNAYFTYCNGYPNLAYVFLVSFIVAFVELCSPKGYDNITIPVSVIFVRFIFDQWYMSLI